jgi:uncharacterized protein (TIRG00374 family)
VSGALNLVLPAKTGDLAKGLLVAQGGKTTTGISFAAVVYERLLDLFGVLAWCALGGVIQPGRIALPPSFWLGLLAVAFLIGLLLYSKVAANGVVALVRRVFTWRRLHRLIDLAAGWPSLYGSLQGRQVPLMLFSLALWLLTLTQIWLFTIALGIRVPLLESLTLTAVALVAGLVPFTFGGIGARDTALVVLLSPYTAPEAAAAVGLLASTRGLILTLLSIPLARTYVMRTLTRSSPGSDTRSSTARLPVS